MPQKNKPLDKELYERVKKEADEKYDTPSAYKSGWIVKTYKERGGKYSGKKTKENLSAWFKEKWSDVGGLDYPVYRPSKRVNKNTPLTPEEIDQSNLKEQIMLKQILREGKLPPFKKISD